MPELLIFTHERSCHGLLCFFKSQQKLPLHATAPFFLIILKKRIPSVNMKSQGLIKHCLQVWCARGSRDPVWPRVQHRHHLQVLLLQLLRPEPPHPHPLLHPRLLPVGGLLPRGLLLRARRGEDCGGSEREAGAEPPHQHHHRHRHRGHHGWGGGRAVNTGVIIN